MSLCRHCLLRKARRPRRRGLCGRCYGDRAIRRLYPADRPAVTSLQRRALAFALSHGRVSAPRIAREMGIKPAHAASIITRLRAKNLLRGGVATDLAKLLVRVGELLDRLPVPTGLRGAVQDIRREIAAVVGRQVAQDQTPQPTTALPGTNEYAAVLQGRVERGEPLRHADDARRDAG